jgi:hypothetical protein
MAFGRAYQMLACVLSWLVSGCTSLYFITRWPGGPSCSLGLLVGLHEAVLKLFDAVAGLRGQLPGRQRRCRDRWADRGIDYRGAGTLDSDSIRR